MSRHMNTGRKLSRNTSHRRALLDNLVRSVILSESIRTTTAKAKEARRVVEKIITKARENTLTARRNVHRTVRDQAALAKLFETIAPRFKTRPGGYTRIVHVQNRIGDNAPMAILELVEKSAPEEKPAEPEKKADKKSEKKSAEAEKKPAKVKAAKGGGDQGSSETAEKKPAKQKKAKKTEDEEK
jgi:large subunit ribosomal protein L17